MKRDAATYALTLRSLAPRAGLFLLVLSAFSLMLLGKAETVLLEQARTRVVDAAMPVLEVLGRPAAALRRGLDRVNGLVFMASENARLREENRRLMRWQTLARQLQGENAALRGELGYVADAGPRFITARVVADTGGAFMRTALLNAGHNRHIRRGQAAMAGEGVAGRIAGVGQRSARLLLLTDLNSRIPVRIETTGHRGILAGTNSARPVLRHVPANLTVTVGDRVVTSGDGGVFPPGLPAGVVAQVSREAIRVEPVVDFSRMAFVRVLDFGPDGLLPPPERPD